MMHCLVRRMVSRWLAATLGLILGLACLLPAADSPNDRQPTDPKSLRSPSSASARAVPIEDLFYSRRVSSPSWSPDGTRIVFTTNLTGRNNLWIVGSEGGWPLQLTVSDDRQSGSVWSPDGKWIVYPQDFGGGEYYDLFAVPSTGGTPVNLTKSPDVSETGALFSPDGKELAIDYKLKTSPATDVAVFNWSSHQVRDLTNEKSETHSWQLRDWSPDGRSILANRTNSGGTDSSVFLIDVTSGNADELTPHQGDAVYFGAAVSPDGKSVLLTSNEKGGYSNVAIVDVATKKLKWLTDVQWEAEGDTFSPDGKLASYVINADGLQTTYVYDLGAGKTSAIVMPLGLSSPAGKPSAFSPKGSSLLLSYQSSQRPSDFWVYDIASKKARQLTYSAVASLNPEDLPAAQLVHYKSFDGKVISAFVWMPFNLKRDGSNPAIVLPHGGPTGQVVDYFYALAAALSSRGYICIAPNVRGSTGYGMEFQKANHQDLGGGDLQDEVYATKFLLDSGYVDAKKIGITGGSYGGFMTLMAVGKTPDVWAAAVEMYGIIDWYTMLQHEDPYLQEYEKSLLGDPVKDKAVYEATSPIKYIRNEKAPLLILQGDNDIRVPKEEAEQVYDILKKEGRIVDAHFYPAEGHGFAKRENQIDSIRRTVEWFDKYLKGSGSSSK